MLEKRRTSMKLGMNLTGVRMSFLSISAIHGYGIMYVLVAGLMEDSVILTLTQVLSPLMAMPYLSFLVRCIYLLNNLHRSLFVLILSGSQFVEDARCIRPDQ